MVPKCVTMNCRPIREIYEGECMLTSSDRTLADTYIVVVNLIEFITAVISTINGADKDSSTDLTQTRSLPVTSMAIWMMRIDYFLGESTIPSPPQTYLSLISVIWLF